MWTWTRSLRFLTQVNMAQASDSYTGNGNTGGVCGLSNADEALVIGNIITAVKQIQTILAQKLGEDIFSEQLGDLSTDGGGIDYGTDTWVTEYGTIANPDPAVIAQILEDAKNGQMVIGPGKAFNVNNGVASWMVLEVGATGLIGGGLSGNVDISNILYNQGTAFTPIIINNTFIQILEKGYYHIDVHIQTGVRTNAGSTLMRVELEDANHNTVKIVEDLYGQHNTPNSGNQTLHASFGFEALPGYYISVSMTLGSGGTGPFNIDKSAITIEQLRRMT